MYIHKYTVVYMDMFCILLTFICYILCSLATKAWGLLREQLEKQSEKDFGVSGTLQRCVARKLITMGTQLPQWLVDRYKVSDYI
jgi:hypothetical protein